MKKSIGLLCAMLIITSSMAFSQRVKVISNEQIPLPKSDFGYNPVLSPAGDYILITESNLKGLSKYDFATKQLQTLTSEKGAGFDVQISEDGSLIAYRSQQYKNRLRYTTLKTFNMSNGKQSEVIKDSRDLEKFVIIDGTVVAVENGNIKTKRISGKSIGAVPAISSVKQGQLYVTHNKKSKLVTPTGNNSNYLWTSISPDGKKMLYYVIEHGKAYVSNLDGTNPISLGVLRTPKWMGNDWVVGMEDYDDGQVITSSKIVMVAANGNNRTDLTNKSVIATNPSGSADASKIVYNTADGKIFLMNIQL